MATITIQEAQATLPELIHRLAPGEVVQLVEEGRVVAEVRSVTDARTSKEPRQLGWQAGSVLYMAPDFDAPLEDMKEYME
jgi:antitoxin (DNA-binding transcriptional repressor) of toxin-antitoxin stability system